MTISSTISRWAYTGDGSSVAFGYGNRIFAAADLRVYVAGLLQALTTDYTVSGVGSPGGGTVTLTAAAADGAAVVIERRVPATQGTDLQPLGAFRAEIIEAALDRMTVLIQQLEAVQARTLTLSPADPAASIGALPDVASRQGRYLAFDADGEPLALTPVTTALAASDFGETLLAVASAAVARVALDVFSKAETAAMAATTGDVKGTLKAAADTGWIMLDDGTIGDASSGASTRANADCQALFVLLWTNVADTWCPVIGGRGASAAADWAAHKQMTLPRALGRALGATGAGSGLTARALGEFLGEEDHTLTVPETPPHTHTGAPGDASGAGGGSAFYNRNGVTGSTGGGEAHNNMQPTLFINWMIKL